MKEKYLNILTLTLLIFLLLNYFTQKPSVEESKNEITVIAEQNSYTIPANINLIVKNNTQTGITINTC
jgi:hypothetical protein